MADIIPFKSRAQLIQEKKDKVRSEWEEWLEFEDRSLKQEMIYDTLYMDKEGTKRYEMTELEIIEDVTQYLTEQELQTIQEFRAWFDKGSDK
ncbi:hypothetical protein [Oceanobacillus sp. CF4.6]|uniref:hypothetical protein n=1 Tax=Oceanobacillus sp. CF4.6 TaxID=3373080 RepID=UPI003EE6BFB9